MRTISFVLLLVIGPFFDGFCQARVWDIGLMEALIGHNKNEFKKQEALRDNQIKMTATQTKAKAEGKKFEEKVKVIHARLTSLGSLISDGKMLLDAYQITKDILKYQSSIMDAVFDDIKLLPIAASHQAIMVDRSTQLIKYIGILAISASDINAMKTSDRRKIIQHIIDQLRVIRGNAYGLSRTLIIARQGDGFRSLNPWQGYVNEDKKLAQNILTKMKF